MQISSILSAVTSPAIDAQPARPEATAAQTKAEDVAKVSQQFESILLRQILSESMKGMLEGGEGGQVYGYMVTDSLANSLSEGGGLGLSSILQSQLGGDKL